MVLCDSCKITGTPDCPVYSFQLDLSIENSPTSEPNAHFVLQLCKACAGDMKVFLAGVIKNIENLGRNP